MSKRAHAMVDGAHLDVDVDAGDRMGLDGQEPELPGPMPGQFPYVPADATSDAGFTSFTTTLKLAPAVGYLKNFFTHPVRFFRAYFRPQQILAVPVCRDNGSRKKILLDAGLADAPATPHQKAKAKSPDTHRSKDNERASPTPLSSLSYPSPPSSPVPDPRSLGWDSDSDSPAQTSTRRTGTVYYAGVHISLDDDDDDFTSIPVKKFAKALPFKGLSASTPASAQNAVFNNAISTSPVPSTPAPAPYFVLDNGVPSSPTISTASPAYKFGLSTSVAANPATPTPRFPKSPALSSWYEDLHRPTKEEVQQKLKEFEGEAEDDVDVSDLSWVSEPSFPPSTPGSSEWELDLRNDDEPVTFEDPPENGNDAYVYENDLSELPDAPPLKKVAIADTAHIKIFYQDDPVNHVLDSFLDIITSSPEKTYIDLFPDSKHHTPTHEQSPIELSPKSLRSKRASPDPEPLADYSESLVSKWEPVDNEDALEESFISAELADEVREKALLSSKEIEEPATTSPTVPAPPAVPTVPTISTIPTAIATPTPTPTTLIAPLTDKENTKLQIIADKYKDLSHQDAARTHVPGCKMTVHDLKTLLPGPFKGPSNAWLNDNVVDQYLTILVEHQKLAAGYKHKKGGAAPPVHNFLSQWYQSLKADKTRVKNWAGRKQLGGEQLLHAKLVLFPICEHQHWRLVAIKPQDREIEYLDSLGWEGPEIVEKVFEWLEQELGKSFKKEDWKVVEEQNSARQLNSSDCGVFTCLNALSLLRGEGPQSVVACLGMDEARRRMAATLLEGRPTTEM